MVKNTQSIIIVLLLANLATTIWFGVHEPPAPVVAKADAVSEHELPPVVSSSVRQKLYDDFAAAFNAGDYDALYAMFGPAAKAQFSKEEAASEFSKLAKYFHSVESGAFNYSELAGTQGNTKIYVLYYVVKLPDDSEFGTTGTLKITVAVQGGAYQVYGIRLNAG